MIAVHRIAEQSDQEADHNGSSDIAPVHALTTCFHTFNIVTEKAGG